MRDGTNTHIPISLICTARARKQGTVTFTVGGKLYSLDLSSPSNCDVSEGDAFDGKADLQVICSEEVMGKMIRKEVQPQQGMETTT